MHLCTDIVQWHAIIISGTHTKRIWKSYETHLISKCLIFTFVSPFVQFHFYFTAAYFFRFEILHHHTDVYENQLSISGRY